MPLSPLWSLRKRTRAAISQELELIPQTNQSLKLGQKLVHSYVVVFAVVSIAPV